MSKLDNPKLLVIDKLIKSVILFSIGMAVARYLGPKQFGLYSHYISVMAMFLPIAMFGLEAITMRKFANDIYYRNSHYLMSAIVFRFLSATLALLVFGIYYHFTLDTENSFLIILTICSVYYYSYSIYFFEYYFRAKLFVRELLLVSFIQIFSSLIVKITLIYFDFSYEYFLMSFVFDFFISGILFFAFYLFKVDRLCISFSREILIELFIKGSPLFISGLLMGFYRNYDIVFLGKVASENLVGNYAMASKLVGGTYIIPVILCNNKLKTLMNASSKELYRKEIITLFRNVIVISFLIYIGLNIIVVPIAKIILGEGYDLFQVLSIYVSLYIVVVSLDTLIQNHFINLNMQNRLLTYSLFIAFFVFIMHRVLFDRYGVYGIIASVILSFPFGIIANCIFLDWRSSLYAIIKNNH